MVFLQITFLNHIRSFAPLLTHVLPPWTCCETGALRYLRFEAQEPRWPWLDHAWL